MHPSGTNHQRPNPLRARSQRSGPGQTLPCSRVKTSSRSVRLRSRYGSKWRHTYIVDSATCRRRSGCRRCRADGSCRATRPADCSNERRPPSNRQPMEHQTFPRRTAPRPSDRCEAVGKCLAVRDHPGPISTSNTRICAGFPGPSEMPLSMTYSFFSSGENKMPLGCTKSSTATLTPPVFGSTR
jgi:hypothetical protein